MSLPINPRLEAIGTNFGTASGRPSTLPREFGEGHGSGVTCQLRLLGKGRARTIPAGATSPSFFETQIAGHLLHDAEVIDEGALRHALFAGEIVAHYQPEYRIEDGRLNSVEALARWQQAWTVLDASEFIPVAERTGLVADLGRKVMLDACSKIAQWSAVLGADDDFRVWVNVSAEQLGSGQLAEELLKLVTSTGTNPNRLGIEITETALLADIDNSVAVLEEIRGLGFKLAIDDFGTGYASLTYLRRFPVDIVKIDRTFTAGLGRRSDDNAIVAAIVGLAHSLGLEVLAEGVETYRQLAELRALRCDLAQGHLLGRPGPAFEIEAALELNRRRGESRRQISASSDGTSLDINSLSHIATLVDATDLFVLHAVGRDQMLNIAGTGRGAAWAGNVHIDPSTEPLLHQAIDGRDVVRVEGALRRIFGPYWAEEAVLTAVGHNVIVFAGKGIASIEDHSILSAATDAAWSATAVPPKKQLADERELGEAALKVARLRPHSRAEAAVAIAEIAATALSCELAAVVLYDNPLESLHFSPASWRPPGSDEEVLATIRELGAATSEGPVFENDTETSPHTHAPLSIEDGLVARCVVPLGDTPRLGVLVCGHTLDGPRGFTDLCQRVALAVAEQAINVLDST